MKKIIIIIGLIAFLTLSSIASAVDITDPEDDVDHIIKDPYSIDQVSNKPNIDVKKVSYNLDGDIVTLSLSVKGVIEDDSSITYYAEYECSDASYQFTYSNGNSNGKTSSILEGESTMVGTAIDHTIDPANTIKVTFNVVGVGSTDGELYGYGGFDFPGLGVNEYWMDNTVVDPEGNNGGGNNGGGTTNKDTPSFEIITVIAAIGIAFIILRRKK